MTRRIATIISGSKGNKYFVNVEKRYCTCPAWRFQKVPADQRTCKHLETVLNSLNGRAA